MGRIQRSPISKSDLLVIQLSTLTAFLYKLCGSIAMSLYFVLCSQLAKCIINTVGKGLCVLNVNMPFVGIA